MEGGRNDRSTAFYAGVTNLTALKTVSMRLRGISEDGESVKELVPELEASFRRVGLTLMTTNGQFKSTYQIMKELAQIWPTLDDMTRSSLLEKVSGARQGNIVASLLSNWKDAESALQTALNSQGSALKEHLKTLDTVHGRLTNLSASMSLMWQASFDSEAFKMVIDSLTKIADGLTWVVDKVGLLTVVLGGAYIAVLALNRGWELMFFKNLGASVRTMTTFNTKLQLAIGNLFGAAGAQEVLAKSSLAAQLQVRGLTLALGTMATVLEAIPGIAIITLLGYGLTKLTEAWSKNREESRRFKEEIEQATTSIIENKQEISGLVKEYENLTNTTGLTNDQQQRLVDVQNRLASLLPDVSERVDEQGNAMLKSSKAVSEYVDSINKLADIKLQEEKINIELRFNERDGNIKKLNEEIKNARLEAENKTRTVTSEYGIPINIAKSTQELLLDNKKLIESEKKKQEEIINTSKDYQTWITAATRGKQVIEHLKKADTDYINVLAEKQARLRVNGEISLSDIEIASDLAEKTLALAKAREIMSVGPTYAESKHFYDTYSYRLDSVRSLLEQAGIEADYASELMQLFSSEAKKALSATFDSEAAYKSLLKTTDSFISTQKDLASVVNDLNKGEEISLETIMKLVSQYPELITSLENEGGILKLNRDAVINLAKAKEAAFKEELRQKEEIAKQDKQLIENKIKQALMEIGLIKSISDARTNSNKILESYLTQQEAPLATAYGSNSRYIDESIGDTVRAPGFDIYRSLLDAFNEAEKALAEIQKTNNLLFNIDFTSALGKSGSKSGDDSIPYNLKDYEHQDQLLANIIEKYKYDAREFAGKLDEESMSQYKIFVDKQVETFEKRIKLATDTLPQMRADAESLLRQYESETDQSKKNEFGRKYDAQIKQIQSIENNINDWSDAIKELTVVQEKDKYVVDTYSESMDKLDQKLSESRNTIAELKSDSQEYRNELMNQSDIIKQKIVLVTGEISVLQKQISANRQLLESGNLLQSQFNELLRITDEKEQKVRQLTSAYIGLNSELINNAKSIEQSNEEWYRTADDIADKVINGIKKALNAQKDLALKAIDAIREAEDKAHDKKMDDLDDELKKYESIVNARLKALDDQNAKDDYEKELAKAQKDRAETQKKIDLLSMDNSMEAQAKLFDLRKKLAEQDENITNIKEKRERDVTKSSLRDSLEAKQKDVESRKKAEDDKYKQSKDTLDKMKKDAEYHFNELINDEERFSKIRENILKGNVEAVKTELNNYSQTFKDVANGDFKFLQTQLGTYWTQFETLTSGKLSAIGASIRENLNLANELKNIITGTPSPGKTTPTGGLDQIGTPPPIQQVPIESEYTREFREYIKNKVEWETASTIRKTELNNRNIALRAKWGFPDYTFKQIKDLQLEKFHSGGLSVGEGIALVRDKELILDPQDTKNFLAAAQIMRSSVSMLKMPEKQNTTSGSYSVTIEHLHLGSGATKKDAENLMSWIDEEIKKRGK